jgi:hypothetical protein
MPSLNGGRQSARLGALPISPGGAHAKEEKPGGSFKDWAPEVELCFNVQAAHTNPLFASSRPTSCAGSGNAADVTKQNPEEAPLPIHDATEKSTPTSSGVQDVQIDRTDSSLRGEEQEMASQTEKPQPHSLPHQPGTGATADEYLKSARKQNCVVMDAADEARASGVSAAGATSQPAEKENPGARKRTSVERDDKSRRGEAFQALVDAARRRTTNDVDLETEIMPFNGGLGYEKAEFWGEWEHEWEMEDSCLDNMTQVLKDHNGSRCWHLYWTVVAATLLYLRKFSTVHRDRGVNGNNCFEYSATFKSRRDSQL